jgi:hypothetical protein
MALSSSDYKNMSRNLKHKNGFIMAVNEYSVMPSEFNEMRALYFDLVRLITKELHTV